MTIKEKALSELRDLLRYTKVKDKLSTLNRDLIDLEIKKDRNKPYKLYHKDKVVFIFYTMEDLKIKVDRELGINQESKQVA